MVTFYKYQGAGNDFIMINNLLGNIQINKDYIVYMCNRHFGIGADGVIILEKSEKADCFMNYYNSDGSLAEMCGNGARCIAKFFLKETGLALNEINLDTRAGIKNIKVNNNDTYSVNMGKPIFKSNDFPTCPTCGKKSLNIGGFDFDCVSIGNPHAITFVEDVTNSDIKNIGPKIENNSNFPNKINVEFVEKINDEYYKVRVCERGCGETLACGTGACAVFSILDKKNNFDKEITLEFPGGNLYLSKNHKGDIILRGSALFVFKGEIILK